MITISISSYNQAEWLPEAIESAISQTLQPDEIIIVDDGSTDNSLEIAEMYARDGRELFKENKKVCPIKVISQVNKGLSSARNTGIMNMKNWGYILFLDADDILLPNCIEKIEKAITETNAEIIAPSFHNFGILNNDVILMENPTIEDFKTANRIGYFSAISRRKLIEIGGYSPRMIHGYEDYHLWHNLLARGATLHTLKEVLVLYRTKPNSMLTTAQQHHEELINQINHDFYEPR